MIALSCRPKITAFATEDVNQIICVQLITALIGFCLMRSSSSSLIVYYRPKSYLQRCH